MKLTNIGGATGILEHRGKRMLFDPWLNEGIFHGAWYHFPPLKIGVQDLGHLDYVYISHIHEDHCARGTIQHINRDAEIIVMDREPDVPNYVLRFLKTHGFDFKKIHRIRPRTAARVAEDLWADTLEGDPANQMSYLIDSALILRWGDFVLYNANDCPQYEAGLRYVRKNYPKLDLALLPYAGGSGYPSCYVNFSPEEKLAEKDRIARLRLQMFVDTAKALEPRYAMPFADQYVVAGSRSHLNKYISHPPGPGVVYEALKEAGFESKALLLNSGQSFDFETGRKNPDEPYQFYSEEDREIYVRDHLTDKVYEHEVFRLDPGVSVERLIRYARQRLWEAQQREQYFPSFSYYLDLSDRERRFRIALNQTKEEEVAWKAPLAEPHLRISAPHTLWVMLLIGHVSWNIADAALFLDYERVPNVYDTKIHAFINYLRI